MAQKLKLGDFFDGDDGRSVIVVNGVKGGAGKSCMAAYLLHVASEKFPGRVKLYEFDYDSNDVAKLATSNGIPCSQLMVMKASGWEKLNDEVFSGDERVSIVNLPGQCENGVEEFGQAAIAAFHKNGVRVATVWALGPDRESLNPLARYLKFGTGEPVFVARAVWQVDDPATDFEEFDEARPRLDLRGGAVFDHLPSPYRMRKRMFSGVKTEDGGLDRWTIAKYLAESSKSIAGAFHANNVNRWLRKMAREIGIDGE